MNEYSKISKAIFIISGIIIIAGVWFAIIQYRGIVLTGVVRPNSNDQRSSISVKDYGAKGDGITDDAPAIAQALSQLNGSKNQLIFPAGTYLLSSAIGTTNSQFPDGTFIQSAIIIRNNNVTISGETGAVLQLADHKKIRIMTIVGTNVRIEGLVFDGNKSQRDGSLPWPQADVVDAMVYAEQTANNIHIRICEFRNGIEDGLGIFGPNTITVERSLSHDNGTEQAGGAGMAINGVSNGAVFGNRLLSNTGPGLWIAFGSKNFTIRENEISHNQTGGIALGGPEGLGNHDGPYLIEGNTVIENGSDGFVGIEISSASNGIVRNNIVNNNYFDGIRIQDLSSFPSTNWRVEGNQCSNTTSEKRQDIGIHIAGMSNEIHIEGNRCVNNGSSLFHQIIIDVTSSVNKDWETRNLTSFIP